MATTPEALQWVVMPVNGTAGATITGAGGSGNSVSVRVVDNQGNGVAGFLPSIYLMIQYNSVCLGSSITLSGAGPSSANNSTSTATFPSLSISPAGTYTLVAYVQSNVDIVNFLSVQSDPIILT